MGWDRRNGYKGEEKGRKGMKEMEREVKEKGVRKVGK